MKTNYYLPKLKTYHLDNGLTIVWDSRQEINHCHLEAVIRAGSGVEPINSSGISYLLENVVYRSSTKSFSNKKDLSDVEDKLGGWFDTETKYYSISLEANFPMKNFLKGIKLFKEKLFNLKFKSNIFESEKKSILQEIEKEEDDLIQKTKHLIFKYRAKGKDSALRSKKGDKKSIKKLTIKDLKEYYKKIFVPSNIVLLISGPKKLKQTIENKIIKDWGRVKRGDGLSLDFRKTSFSGSLRKHIKQLGLKETYFGISFPIDSFSYANERYLWFLRYLLSFCDDSICERVSNKGLTYHFDVNHFVLPDKAFYYFFGHTKDLSNFEKILSYLKDNLINNVDKSLNKSLFKEAKEKFLLFSLIDFEEAPSFLDWLGYDFAKNKEVMDPKEEIEKIKDISFEKTRDLMKKTFSLDSLNVITIGKGEK